MAHTHKYLNLTDWEYQSIDNFSTYPFLNSDLSVEAKFRHWVGLASSYHSTNSVPSENARKFSSKLGITAGSELERCLDIYIRRAVRQVDFLKETCGDLEGKSILDFGSGHGILSVPIIDNKANYYALEYIRPVAQVRDYFLSSVFSSNVYTENSFDYTAPLNETEKFDVIFANNVLSELSKDNIKSSLDTISKLLKVDGVLVVTDWIRRTRKQTLFAALANTFQLVNFSFERELQSSSYKFLFKKGSNKIHNYLKLKIYFELKTRKFL
jgi:2-polyprenyl-3-methyl-5-hydroxy-6-metoxy-1,4-benzoquinol methylase